MVIKKKVFLFLASFVLIPGLLFTQNNTKMTGTVDWKKGMLNIRVESILPDSDQPLPVRKFNQQQAIQRDFPFYIRESLSNLLIDSNKSFSQVLNESPHLLLVLDKLASAAIIKTDSLSLDLRTLIMEFEVPLFPFIAEPFLAPGYTPRPPRFLSWQPSAGFTGLVIYARGDLPVHGERDSQGKTRMASVSPCLFPKIFDQDMNLVLSSDLMDQNVLALNGVAIYSHDTLPEDLAIRVGNYPFYTTALGLFGQNSTDILLPREDVRRLLSREENRELLRQGRIVIIY